MKQGTIRLFINSKVTNDNPAIYKFKGDELYIRAKIISSRKHPNPYAEGDFEMAWTQPILLYTKN